MVSCITPKPFSTGLYEEDRSQVNANNSIYKVGTIYKLHYTFINKEEERTKCIVLDDDPTIFSNWNLVNETLQSDSIVDYLEVTVVEKLFGAPQSDEAQTMIEYNYKNHKHKELTRTWTGVVENSRNVWWHPMRQYEFHINEFSPFPYIKYPLKKGVTWTDTISPYPDNVYDKWIKFDEQIDVVSTYKITGKTKLETKLGELTCYVTEAKAVNLHSKPGYLTSYFNEQYGFVKLEYTNIDGSRLVIELVEFQSPESQ